MKKYFNSALLMMCCCVLPALAHAYVGPGAGLSALGSILAFLGVIFLLVVGFLWYPIKRLIKGKKKDTLQTNGNVVNESNPDSGSLREESTLTKK